MYKKKLDYKERVFDSLNNRKYDDLSENFQNFIKYVFPDIRKNDLIICEKRSGAKIDFSIRVKNVTKNISVKQGTRLNVYKDRIANLILFLLSIKVSKECILAILSYHYADGTHDGSGGYSNSFGQLLAVDYKKEIEIVDKEFENKELLEKVLDFVLIKEKNGKSVDYFYYGDDRRGFFRSAEEVKNNIINDRNKYRHDFMRIGVMNLLPLNRNVMYSEHINYSKHICVLKINLAKYIKK